MCAFGADVYEKIYLAIFEKTVSSDDLIDTVIEERLSNPKKSKVRKVPLQNTHVNHI